MQSTEALLTWLGLMTPDELAELAASYDWTAVHLDWSARPKIATFLTTIDALIVGEQRRRVDPGSQADVVDSAFAVGMALAALDKGDLQVLLHSYLRLARNRERDASEPVQRFHAAVSDLLTAELASRLDSTG